MILMMPILIWQRPCIAPVAGPIAGDIPVEAAAFQALRRQLRRNQAELAEDINHCLSRSYDGPKVSRWENGKDPVPDEVAVVVKDMVKAQPRDVRVISIANQKGGVAKTTSALNLALAFVNDGFRVLLVDLDPQATATASLFGPGASDLYRQGRTAAHVILRNADLSEAVVRAGAAVRGRSAPFDILASHIELAETDSKREPGVDLALREALEEVRKDYDWIVVDSPPNLGMLTWMSLAAADFALVPVQPEPFDSMGVGLIVNTVRKVQRRTNVGLQLVGILPTRFFPRQYVDREVLRHLMAEMKNIAPVLEPVPNTTTFNQAALEGRIALDYAPKSPAVQVYVRLARAFIDGKPLPLARFDTDIEAGSEPATLAAQEA
jgi:chromosome partitioning protein